MGQTAKTSSTRKPAGSGGIQDGNYWLENIQESIRNSVKEKSVSLFVRIPESQIEFIGKVSRAMGTNGSQFMDLFILDIKREHGSKGVPRWLADAIKSYTPSDEDELKPFFCRISVAAKSYLEVLAARAGVSMALLAEILIRVLQNDRSSRKL
jgi:hypothetical protein